MFGYTFRNENYYVVNGWMINELKLSGNMLTLYAIIYGFSQNGEEYTGSLSYMCDFLGCNSKNTVIKALKDLIDGGYILKREEIINNVKFNKYRVNLDKLCFFGGFSSNLGGSSKNELVYQNCERGSSKIDMGGSSKNELVYQNQQIGSSKNEPNNIYINNNNINNNNIKGYNSVLERIENLELKNILLEFIKMRKAMKKPLTDYAFSQLVNRLNKMDDNVINQIEILKQSINNCWLDIYPLKDKKQVDNNSSGNYFLDKLNSSGGL